MTPEIKDYLSFIAYEARNLLGRTCAIASTRFFIYLFSVQIIIINSKSVQLACHRTDFNS